MTEYMNIETGEILTEAEAREQWAQEYDGGDPTNNITFAEYYQKAE